MKKKAILTAFAAILAVSMTICSEFCAVRRNSYINY